MGKVGAMINNSAFDDWNGKTLQSTQVNYKFRKKRFKISLNHERKLKEKINNKLNHCLG